MPDSPDDRELPVASSDVSYCYAEDVNQWATGTPVRLQKSSFPDVFPKFAITPSETSNKSSPVYEGSTPCRNSSPAQGSKLSPQKFLNPNEERWPDTLGTVVPASQGDLSCLGSPIQMGHLLSKKIDSGGNKTMGLLPELPSLENRLERELEELSEEFDVAVAENAVLKVHVLRLEKHVLRLQGHIELAAEEVSSGLDMDK
ncbi:hypothetical protein CPB83DRAFT_911682 [Crepidotus variabilis]|uniref:Uncharacterized protein n=1 Tax=Crepidotus variabilis TaxID=179855 RepID=A0A9P6E3A7_9AGAR|nr:hypothetical protein CPB83DRAFT_911682 [Crepidotus variabilis]